MFSEQQLIALLDIIFGYLHPETLDKKAFMPIYGGKRNIAVILMSWEIADELI